MRVVRVDGRTVAPGDAAVTAEDPLTRSGDALIETMRAVDGGIPLLERHLARMEASAAALGMAEAIPSMAVVREELGTVVAQAGPGDLRVRVCVSPRPTLWVEAEPVPPLPAEPPVVSAVSVTGAWCPGLRAAEHKTAGRAGWAAIERRAAAAGVDAAVVLDERGRLGEASTANLMVHLDAEWVTAPATGLLPGIGRAVVLEAVPGVVERAATRAEWTAAREIVLVGAFSGARAVGVLDGRLVGGGTPGELARACHGALREALRA